MKTISRSYLIHGNHLQSIFNRGVWHVLGFFLDLADCHHDQLGTENGGDHVLPSQFANALHSERAFLKVWGCQLALWSLLSQVENLLIDLRNALLLHLFDIREKQSFRWFHTNRYVMVLLNNVLTQVPVFISRSCYEVWVYYRVLGKRYRCRFHEEGIQCYLRVLLLELFEHL